MDEKLARLRAAWSAIPATEFAPFPADIALSQTGIQKCLHWDILDTFPTIQPLVPFTGRTLIVNGAWDLRTPLENAQAAAATLPGATLVTVPAEGHSLLGYSPCANRAFADFIAARPVQQCDPVEPFRNAAVAPTSLKAQKPWPGVSGLRSLTLRAVYRTIGDVTYTAYGPGPFVGLRGGTLKPSVSPDRSKYTVTLNKIVYCPGVVVTGTIEMVGNVSHLKVTGAGSHGTLTITAKSITGTLDGKKIRASGSG
jgi:hypothetical protein